MDEFSATKNGYCFERQTTMENLAMNVNPCYGLVCKYGDHVLMVDLRRGRFGRFVTAIYEFTETPEEIGAGEIECRLNFCAASVDTFEDGGHAMAWAIQRVNVKDF
mgnify:CR=1 FL=1